MQSSCSCSIVVKPKQHIFWPSYCPSLFSSSWTNLLMKQGQKEKATLYEASSSHTGWLWKRLGVYICFSYLVHLLKHADVNLFLYLFNVLRGLYLILSLGSHFLSLCFICPSPFFPPHIHAAASQALRCLHLGFSPRKISYCCSTSIANYYLICIF